MIIQESHPIKDFQNKNRIYIERVNDYRIITTSVVNTDRINDLKRSAIETLYKEYNNDILLFVEKSSQILNSYTMFISKDIVDDFVFINIDQSTKFITDYTEDVKKIILNDSLLLHATVAGCTSCKR